MRGCFFGSEFGLFFFTRCPAPARLPGAPQGSPMLSRGPWGSPGLLRVAQGAPLVLPGAPQSSPGSPRAPQRSPGSLGLRKDPINIGPRCPQVPRPPNPGPPSPRNPVAKGYPGASRVRGKGTGTCVGTGTGAVLWHSSLLLELSADIVLRNHVWGDPTVWISSASSQTARVELLARRLSSTSGLQRVLQCEIEKKLANKLTLDFFGPKFTKLVFSITCFWEM